MCNDFANAISAGHYNSDVFYVGCFLWLCTIGVFRLLVTLYRHMFIHMLTSLICCWASVYMSVFLCLSMSVFIRFFIGRCFYDDNSSIPQMRVFLRYSRFCVVNDHSTAN